MSLMTQSEAIKCLRLALQTVQDALPPGDLLHTVAQDALYATMSVPDQCQSTSEAIGCFAIEVEKMLCAKLGREWSVTGISIESLLAELSPTVTDYEAIEREHLGDPDKKTGIYHPDNMPKVDESQNLHANLVHETKDLHDRAVADAAEKILDMFRNPFGIGGLEHRQEAIKSLIANTVMHIRPPVIGEEFFIKNSTGKPLTIFQPSQSEIKLDRNEILEEAALIAEKVGIQTYMTDSFIRQVKEAREVIAKAIRALKSSPSQG